MQITEHVYSTHIEENQNTFGAMHPGGTQIYFVGDPNDRMVMIDSGEPYRSWTRQILAYYEELGRPNMSAILISHGHGDHIGGLDRLQEVSGLPGPLPPQAGAPAAAHTGRRLGGTVKGQRGVDHRRRSDFCVPCSRRATKKTTFATFCGPTGCCSAATTCWATPLPASRDLKPYLASLGRMAQTRPQVVCPGHGDTILRGEHRIQQQIAHRQGREDQVLAALTGGANTVGEIVSAVYPRNLRKNLREAAARNVRTPPGPSCGKNSGSSNKKPSTPCRLERVPGKSSTLRYTYDTSGPKGAIGCGILLLTLGGILLSPVIAVLIDVLGWVLVVLGLVGIISGALGWLSSNRRAG